MRRRPAIPTVDTPPAQRTGELAVTFTELMAWAKRRGATWKAVAIEIGCTDYRLRRIRACPHWISRAVLLEAANRAMARRGHGFQTTLFHFTSRQDAGKHG